VARCVAVQIVVALNPTGRLYPVVDDTSLHKRGKHVYGLGWFRDAAESRPAAPVRSSGVRVGRPRTSSPAVETGDDSLGRHNSQMT
jgi:hypothetical protein